MQTAALLAAMKMLARTLDDLERTRIMLGNRVSKWERAGATGPDEVLITLKGLEKMERSIELALREKWREHPLAAWQQSVKGVAEKSIARLVAETGDPCWREVGHFEGEGEKRRWVVDGVVPRTVGQLWSYCGVGDPQRRRRKGMAQEDALAGGNANARKAVWMIAYLTMLSRDSDYRPVYDLRRAVTVDRVADGKPWTKRHAHNDALRIVAKTFLRDLWLAAARIHAASTAHRSDGPAVEELPGGHQGIGAHSCRAPQEAPARDAHSRIDSQGAYGVAGGSTQEGGDA